MHSDMQFIKSESEYLDNNRLVMLKDIEKYWHTSRCLLGEHIINYDRLKRDIQDVQMRETIRRRELTISHGDITKLAENIKGLYKILEQLEESLNYKK